MLEWRIPLSLSECEPRDWRELDVRIEMYSMKLKRRKFLSLKKNENTFLLSLPDVFTDIKRITWLWLLETKFRSLIYRNSSNFVIKWNFVLLYMDISIFHKLMIWDVLIIKFFISEKICNFFLFLRFKLYHKRTLEIWISDKYTTDYNQCIQI